MDEAKAAIKYATDNYYDIADVAVDNFIHIGDGKGGVRERERERFPYLCRAVWLDD